MNKVALVTGASSGIGKSTVEELAKYGFTVYAAARRLDRLKDIDEGIPVALDLTDDASIRACVDYIIGQERRIDVLINNAGYGSYGAVEDVPPEEARRQFDPSTVFLAMGQDDVSGIRALSIRRSSPTVIVFGMT